MDTINEIIEWDALGLDHEIIACLVNMSVEDVEKAIDYAQEHFGE